MRIIASDREEYSVDSLEKRKNIFVNCWPKSQFEYK